MIGRVKGREFGGSGHREFGRSARAVTAFVSAFMWSAALGIASAQTPQTTSTPPPNNDLIVVEKPTYTSINLEVTVNKPVADIWKRIGGYCAIGEWFQMPKPCTILSGTENDLGAVRSAATDPRRQV